MAKAACAVAAGTGTGMGLVLAFCSVAGSSLYLLSSAGFRVTVGVMRDLGFMNSAIGSCARCIAAPVNPLGASTIGRLFSRVFVFDTKPQPGVAPPASVWSSFGGADRFHVLFAASGPPTVVDDGSGVKCEFGGFGPPNGDAFA